MTDKHHRAIEKFWKVVEARRKKLESIESADDPAYDACLEALQAIDEGLYLEISIDESPRELIVTAEGEKELFPRADAVVAAAPNLPGWTVLALKPKLGFPESAIWEDYEILLSDVRFEPLLEDDDELGIRFLVPGASDAELDDAHNALLRACDHGLGERAFAESIEFTEVAALPSGAAADAYRPLVALEAYLEERRVRRIRH